MRPCRDTKELYSSSNDDDDDDDYVVPAKCGTTSSGAAQNLEGLV